MKRLLFPALILLLSAYYCAGQSVYKVKGVLTDTLIQSPLYLSSVIMVRTSDSVIENFVRADDNGKFEISVTKPGKYIFQVAHPGYADYADLLQIKDSILDLGTISMLSKEHMLEEFVFVQQVAAIKIKGDTTEYMADSFNVKDGASVEDLLKKLPGIQVDKNGKITAHGTEVQKILVDGEEFFSDDPKVVTQGLQSAIVSKVQVFDKKSDQAEFTGIDDGEKTKTINLQLKENMKKGFFGKVDAGGGTDGYYQQQGMINGFKGKRQLAAFGILSNTDKVGLGWNERENYGSGNGITEIGDDGSWNRIGGNFDEFSGWNGNYNGDGLPKVSTGGAHFANRWNEGKQHISGSYRYALQQVNATGDNSKVYALAGDTSRINTETKNQFNSGEKNGVNALMEFSIDSLTSLKVVIDGGTKKSNSTSIYHTETYNIFGDAQGAKTINDRTIASNSEEQTLNADLLLRRKFAKRGRTLSLDFKENYKDIKGGGTLVALTGATDTIDQRKVSNSNSLVLYGKLNYTEPLSKTLFAEGNYAMTINNSTALNSSLDRSPFSGSYDVLRDSFSSNYSYNIAINRGGVGLRYVDKKLNMSIGSDVSNSAFLQTDRLHGDTSIRYEYVNIFPRANITYKIARQTSFNGSYQGNTNQPTIQQIQPLNQNTDPLNITIGNPNLKQEFNNRFNFRFNNYKTLKDRYTYVGIGFTTTSNAISTSQTVSGPSYVTEYINVDGNYSGYWWGGYSFKLKKPQLNIRFNSDGNTRRVISYINGEQNTSINNTYSFGTEFSVEKEDKYEFRWEPGVSYNDNKSTINSLPLNYWVFNNELSGSVEIPGEIEIESRVTMMFRQKTVVFNSNNSVIKWNASISKKFFKKKQLIAKLSVFDILNQNVGFTRTAQSNVVTQNNYNTIRRYGMLSLVWNFRYTPGLGGNQEED